jgi:hypothetical protein
MLLGLTKKNFELDFEYDYVSLMWWLSAKSFVNIFFNIFFADKVFQIAFGYLGSCVSKRYFGQSKWTVDYIGSILI